MNTSTKKMTHQQQTSTKEAPTSSASKAGIDEIYRDTSQTSEKQITGKVKQTELILFTTQLSVMLDSGVVISDAIDAIAEQSEQGTLKKILCRISDKIKGGDTFSRALSGYPKIFNSMFISMVKASEASGTMPRMLAVLSGYLEFELKTRKQIKSALTYPFIMALMAVAATGTLMFFVLPRFTKIYEARGAALPTLTRMLIGFSGLFADFKTLTSILTVIFILSIAFYYWAKTMDGKRIIDKILIHIPVIGSMFIDAVVTRSMRIMATMLNTGVNLLEAIEVVRGSCENYHFKLLWRNVDDKIRDGYQLSESISISPGAELISPGIIQMLQAGEKSGNLGSVCDKVSIFYEKQLEDSIKKVCSLIEPVMITILGIIIGTIAIALLLPVFRISTVVAH